MTDLAITEPFENVLTVFELASADCKGEYIECSITELYSRVYEDIYVKGNITDADIGCDECAAQLPTFVVTYCISML
jgi:hypothetical protein